jgi:glycosyltransferase involved in cell wall biosynthesis
MANLGSPRANGRDGGQVGRSSRTAAATTVVTPELSIVIPVHNGAGTLPAQLEALIRSVDDRTEIVIVDNRSTDGTRTVAERFAAANPGVRVVLADQRAGEPYARNVGLAAAKSDRIAFCDCDDVVAPTWVTAMRDALGRAEFVTGPVELDHLNPPWLAGVRGRRIFAEVPRTVRDIPFAHGCNLGVQRAAARVVGGFDEAVRIGADVDFAIRAHLAGVELTWDDRAVVHYRHRTSARERWRQALAYGRAAQHLHEVAGEPWTLRRRTLRQGRRVLWLIGTSYKTLDRTHRTQWLWTLAVALGEVLGTERGRPWISR